MKIYILVDDTYTGSTKSRINKISTNKQDCLDLKEALDSLDEWKILEYDID